MNLLLAILAVSDVEPPTGGISALAWVIILALVGAMSTICGVALGWVNKLYDDLKACNAAKAAEAEEILAMLRVARVQMERSKSGGK